MITAYATLKKACANANHAGKRLDDEVRVQTPAGERELLIARIAYEAPA